MATFPVFMFFRTDEPDVDGVLFLNVFGRKYPTGRHLREIEEIIRDLRADAEAGRLTEIKVGWGGDGLKPTNGVDTNDATVMAEWFGRAYVVDVKLDRSAELAVVDEDVERA